MTKCLQTGAVIALAVVAAVVISMFSPNRQAAFGKTEDAKSAGARYTVVMTEGHNLLVTDNGVNKLYFYTIDKDKPIGSPLKLRASLDLGKVGEPEINITEHAVQK
jgi:hypothetical protein